MALTVATLGGVALSMSHAGSGPEVGRARFTSDGSAIRPVGWRQWVHVSTRYKPIGLNILDQKLTKTPEILNAYVEPVRANDSETQTPLEFRPYGAEG
jgi:hypothetical protein